MFSSKRANIVTIPPTDYFKVFKDLLYELTVSHSMSGVVISLNEPYSETLEIVDKAVFERNMVYVDCASALTRMPTPVKKHNVIVVNPVTLSDISIAISEALKKIESVNVAESKMFIVFNSITALLIYYGQDDILKFLHALGIKINQLGVTALFLVVEQDTGKELVKMLSMVYEYHPLSEWLVEK